MDDYVTKPTTVRRVADVLERWGANADDRPAIRQAG
jgi:hypothetical protein